MEYIGSDQNYESPEFVLPIEAENMYKKRVVRDTKTER